MTDLPKCVPLYVAPRGVTLDAAISEVAKLKLSPKQKLRLEEFLRGVAHNEKIWGTPAAMDATRVYEFKTIEISAFPDSRLVFAYVVTGSLTDEGTAAEIFCRTTRHISITKRGAVCLLNRARWCTKRQRKVFAANGRGIWEALNGLTL